MDCGRSGPTARRSNLAGWAGYGYCASHSRFFRGLRLYLVCTPADARHLAPATPKIDEREVLAAMFDREPHLAADRSGLLLICDKGFASAEFEAGLSRSASPGSARPRPAPGRGRGR